MYEHSFNHDINEMHGQSSASHASDIKPGPFLLPSESQFCCPVRAKKAAICYKMEPI